MFYFDTLFGKQIMKSDYLDGVNHFFTTRDGFDFNMISAARILSPNQTHSSNVEIADDRIEYPDTDGLIISKPNDAIYLRFADCTPLIFYDTKKQIASISHAGWRGTAAKIGVLTINKMKSEFGSDMKDIVAVVGPAISICCYEVGDDVKDTLLSTVKDKTKLYEGNRVDLKSINARQLEEAGVEKIDICPYCTSCNNDKFFSYRKENGTPNRHYAFIML